MHARMRVVGKQNGKKKVLLDPGTYRYFDAIMSLDNAAPRSTRHHYSTDVIADRALEFLGDAIDAGRQQRQRRRPFFLAVTPIGPHANVDRGGAFEAPIPARRHSHLFPDVKVPRSPNFNPDTVRERSYTLLCTTTTTTTTLWSCTRS